MKLGMLTYQARPGVPGYVEASRVVRIAAKAAPAEEGPFALVLLENGEILDAWDSADGLALVYDSLVRAAR